MGGWFESKIIEEKYLPDKIYPQSGNINGEILEGDQERIDLWLKSNEGKFGNYIPHSVITQRLLEVCGPYTWEVVELIRQEKDGKVVGCFGKLTVEIDQKIVTITSIGDVEHDQGSDGINAKHAESDAFKRCAMKTGLGLHLWAGDEYYLDKKLNDDKSQKNLKLKSA